MLLIPPGVERAAGLSVERLSRLVSQGTGMRLRSVALWSRLLHLLSNDSAVQGNIASAAYAAGFADHAHLTRTYRRMLGRAPSEFRGPAGGVAALVSPGVSHCRVWLCCRCRSRIRHGETVASAGPSNMTDAGAVAPYSTRGAF